VEAAVAAAVEEVGEVVVEVAVVAVAGERRAEATADWDAADRAGVADRFVFPLPSLSLACCRQGAAELPPRGSRR